jgi:hypothetical protein
LFVGMIIRERKKVLRRFAPSHPRASTEICVKPFFLHCRAANAPAWSACAAMTPKHHPLNLLQTQYSHVGQA